MISLRLHNIRRSISRYLQEIGAKSQPSILEKILLGLFAFYRSIKGVILGSSNKVVSRAYLRTRSIGRHLSGNKFNFVTMDDATVWTTDWMKMLDLNCDMIVAIPRSGMLIASLIALKLGKPLTTPELFMEGKYWMSHKVDHDGVFKGVRNILVIDDSVNSGKAMQKSVDLLLSKNKNYKIIKAALMATEEGANYVDHYYKVVPYPRFFEWTMLHRRIESPYDSGNIAVDLDGVLCENCPSGVDADEKKYVNWIKTARPYLIPHYEIDAVVSGRLEKYREDTENWLRQQGVKYKELILWNIPSKQERNGQYAQHKIDYLLKNKPDMFWESSIHQSKQIHRETRIPTLCIDEMTLYG